jgi:DNA-binding NarL/FixJ family response regulator
MKATTILLAEDQEIVRDGLRALIEIEQGIEIVGCAQNGREAVRLTMELLPDIVIMDIVMPLLNGLEAARQILTVAPNMKIIILSAHCDDAYIEQAVEIGVKGYLIKQASVKHLFKAIREIQKGNTFFCPSIAKRITEIHQRSLGTGRFLRKKTFRLSLREREILQLIAEGLANKQAAAELGISIKTIEKHRQHLMEKLNIHEIAGLTRYAISKGVIKNPVQLTIAGEAGNG